MIFHSMKFFLFVSLFLLANSSGAQDGDVAKIVYLQDVTKLSNAELSDALSRLRKQTKVLESEIRNPGSTTGSGTRQMPGSGTRNGSTTKRLSSPSNNSIEKKVGDIERNIQLLQKIYNEKKRRKKNGSSNGTMSAPMQGSGSGSRNSDSNGSGSRELDGSSSKMSEFPELKLPKQVVSNIVDPFELGNSLLMNGNTAQAIKFYNLVPDDQLSPHDLHWLYLLKACCHRANGNLEEAERTYREVANVKNGRRASEAARGWLKYVSSRQNIEEIVEDYKARADTTLQKAQTVLETFDGK